MTTKDTRLVTLKESDMLNAPVAISKEQMKLIKDTVAKDATDQELSLFVYDCKRQGVHPLDKLVHFTKRSGRYTPITSVDFMRMRAADTGELAGNDDPMFTFADGETVIPTTATAVVWRLTQGGRYPYTATARWHEYKPPSGQDHMWLKMPQLMLGKCAEALALRKAFPKQLHGLYERAEMMQATADEGRSYGEAASGAGERGETGRESPWSRGLSRETLRPNSPSGERRGAGPDSDKVEAEITVPSDLQQNERATLITKIETAKKTEAQILLAMHRLDLGDGDWRALDLAGLAMLAKHVEIKK